MQLMQLAITRGYFHGNATPQREITEISAEEIDVHEYSSQDLDCAVVPTSFGYAKRDFLEKRLMEELIDAGGRLSQEDLAFALDVNKLFVQQTILKIIKNDESENKIVMVGDDYIMLGEYFREMEPAVRLALSDAGGCISVSHLANQVLLLPSDIVLENYSKQLTDKGVKVELMGGMTFFCTDEWAEQEKLKIQGAFEAILEPTFLETVTHLHSDWDTSYVLKVVRDLCQNRVIKGTIKESGESSSKNGFFVPDIYLCLQRESLEEQYSTQGYVTIETCRSIGIGSMSDHVRESFPSAQIFDNFALDSERIINPIIPVLQDAISENSFCDMRMHIPEPLLHFESDLIALMDNIVTPQIGKEGEVIFSQGEMLYISCGMAKNIQRKILPPLIEDYAKIRAEKLFVLKSKLESDVPEGKKERKSKRKKDSKTNVINYGVAPLGTVARAVLEAYPDLMDIQGSDDDLNKEPVWEIVEGENDNDGPILSLCRRIIYKSSFIKSCKQAIEAELDRLRLSTSTCNRKVGAAKMKSREGMFEDTFAAACHQLQLHAKALSFFSADEDHDNHKLLQNDFLRSNCASFASRITEYCLFENDLEGDVFEITYKEGDHTKNNDDSVPRYCRPIEQSCETFSKPYLSCIMNTDADPNNRALPLPTLRQVLSGSLGVTLARLWSHCGEDCYDNADVIIGGKAGNADIFLDFAKDNCLSICGLPFKLLDKKSEKQFMFARRKELTGKLENTENPASVLNLSIMLLCQQIRGLAVAGPHLPGPILNRLLIDPPSGKKVPTPVAELLVQLSKEVKDSDDVNEDLVQKVKSCGLSRDILKHEI